MFYQFLTATVPKITIFGKMVRQNFTFLEGHQVSNSGGAEKRRPAPPIKPKNKDRRGREHLFPEEVKRLRSAAKSIGRYGQRNSAMILMAYRHALRVGEVIDLRWDQISFANKTILIKRLKDGINNVQHFLEQDEIRELTRLKNASADSPFVFCNRSGEPLSRRTVHAMIAVAGRAAGIAVSVHPHMLRHAKGHQLANRGIDTRAIQIYFGHKQISSTTRYTDVVPERFRGFGLGD